MWKCHWATTDLGLAWHNIIGQSQGQTTQVAHVRLRLAFFLRHSPMDHGAAASGMSSGEVLSQGHNADLGCTQRVGSGRVVGSAVSETANREGLQ